MMIQKHAVRWLAACLIFALPDVSMAAEQTTVKQYTIEQFFNTTSLTGSSFSPDESSILFSSNKTGIFNVYKLPMAGGTQEQITRSTKESTYVVSYFPADNRILYQYDKGGNENIHLYLLDLNGQEKDLTPGENVKAEFLKWSRDDKHFFYATNERDPRFFDVYKMDISEFQRTLIFQDSVGYQIGDISDDEKYIALSKTITTTNADLYLYDLQKKEMKLITPHEGEVAYSVASFDVKSQYLYYLTDVGSQFQYLERYDVSTGKKQTVEKTDWDISYAYFSYNGKYRVVGINQDARTKIIIYDELTGKPIPLPAFPDGDITSVDISRSEKLMSFYFSGDRSPANLYVYDLATQKVTRLTDSQNPEINPEDLADAQVIRFKSFDGMEIPSLLFKPHQASPEDKVPAILLIHGGPGGQTRKGYSALIQYLVNHGYVILGVNNRGSSGYGKDFFKADDRKHGYEPLWDCVESKKYLAALPYVDASRIGIMGGSYGGYMVLAALTLKPNEFAVGVDLFGISNWVRTLESIPPYWEAFREALYVEIGDPAKDKEMLLEVSPLFNADKISKPLMVLQGANDPRVLKQESDDIVNAIKKKDGVVEYIIFDNEGHGFTKKENQIRGYKAILDFLNKYLRK